ncbi:hypothetical protein DXG01_003016 [Tephrocybe rancida]|nr:hypothetical protein DXG01_003016 [Tephrocybe rancida]
MRTDPYSGGTAGNVIANRLTENHNINVLIIESGPSNLHVLNSIVPFFATQLEDTEYDWNFTTIAQDSLGGRVLDFPRGHILGGSSSISESEYIYSPRLSDGAISLDAMFYTRGSSSDFDRFAAVTGDDGWSWDKLQPYIRKNEKWTAPADHHNATGQFDPAVHGFHGINAVSLGAFPHPSDPRVIQTTSELPDDFPFNLDMNSGNPLGLGWLQVTIKRGERSSSATSYLGAKFIDRQNLHVLLNTRVTRLLETRAPGPSQPVIRTVEFADEDTQKPRITLTATKEVILSAGAIGTPHILLHSGIGDAKSLKAIGIQPVVDLQDVGRNLIDQPALGNAWLVNSNDTLDEISANQTIRDEALQQWEKNRTGPLAASPTTHLAFSRIPSDSPIFNSVRDPTSGKNTPHYELVISNGAGLRPMQGHFISIGTTVVSPTARGSVSLNSTDPFEQPLIDPAYLATEFDIFAMREAVRSAQKFFTAPVWKDYILSPVGGLENATSDQLLDDYIRKGIFTSAHPVGTAAMSAKNANFGVVDPDLRAKGISGLRIVDASVMPFVPCAHTQAPVYIIAERASDLIKEAWGLL